MKNKIDDIVCALKAYYALPDRDNGGVVHIITEDGNVAQHYAEDCVVSAECGSWAQSEGGLEADDLSYQAEDIRIAKMLAAMSSAQRRQLYENYDFYPDYGAI